VENPEQNFDSPEQEEKPPFLYHASPNREINEFEPRVETFRDPEEGPVIFATPDKAYASMFLVPSDDRWTQKSVFDGVNCHIISDKKLFEELDQGGTIYSLPSETFETDPKRSKTGREWTGKKTVSLSDKTPYKSGLEAMIENGVQVYFVDKSTFKKIREAGDHGLSILKSLESENQQRGKNVVKFEDEK